MFHVPEKFRITKGEFASDESYGCNGLFVFKKANVRYICQASDGLGWEHVSVSLSVRRTPDWEEMCMIKDIFWHPNDCVIQFHPSKENYVNFAEYCLHLWRPIGVDIVQPSTLLVGPK